MGGAEVGEPAEGLVDYDGGGDAVDCTKNEVRLAPTIVRLRRRRKVHQKRGTGAVIDYSRLPRVQYHRCLQ